MNPQHRRPRAATLPSKADLLAFIATRSGKVGTREVARAFGLKNAGRADLKRLLRELADEGRLEHRRKKLHRPGTLPPVTLADITGRDGDGELIAIPTEWDEEAHGAPPKIRVHIPRRARPGESAGVGDRALLRIEEIAEDDDGVRHSGRVVKVLDRAKARVLGIFRALPGGGGRLVPVSKKQLGRELSIPPGATADAADGDLVSVDIARAGRLGLATARVTEKLGSLKNERAVSLIAIHAHGIPQTFSGAALAESEAAAPAALAGREDWRAVPFVTIDPPDAKDHDDAVQADADSDPGNRGGFIVCVAIADVAHYVRPGSALDREALERGNSVYFPDRVVPMLPERISNDLCSLQARRGPRGAGRAHGLRRRRAKARPHLPPRADALAAKLSYAQAQAAIDGRARRNRRAAASQRSSIRFTPPIARSSARATSAARSISICPSARSLLKDDKTVERVVIPERLDAHRLIEEFMIQANVAAAETLERAHLPLIYRVHDEPAREKTRGVARIPADARSVASPRAACCKAGAVQHHPGARQRPRRGKARQRGGAAHARRRPNMPRRITAISASTCAATRISPRRSAATPT